MTYRLAIRVSERAFQDQVIDLLHLHGFKVAHFRPGMTSRTYTDKKGKEHNVWVTPVQADGVGFPDIVALRDAQLRTELNGPGYVQVYAGCAWELKAKGKKASPEQLEWLRLFKNVGFHTGVYCPEQLEEINDLLESWQ